MKIGAQSLDNVDQIITIAEFKESNGGLSSIRGKIIEIYSDAILIKDDTGMIFVTNTYIPPYYYSSYIYRTYTFTGYLVNYHGRKEMKNTTYNNVSYTTGEYVDYEPVSLSEIVSYDHYDDSIFGKPVQITGTLTYEVDYYDYHYYLSDGYDKIRLDNVYYLPDLYISNYLGLEITICGRVYGLDPYASQNDVWTIEVARQPVLIKNYSNEEVVDLIGEQVLKDYNNYTYRIFDEIYLTPNYSLFPNATLTYEVVSGNEFVDFYDNYGTFYWSDTDNVIKFKLTVTSGEVSKDFIFSVLVQGIPISSLDDVYLETDGTTKLYLRGVLLHIAPDGAYFLVENEVYFLANAYTDKYVHYIGSEYLIRGYRAKFDGEVNLRYYPQILEWLDDKPDDYPEPMELTIQEVYQLDVRDLERKILHISGTLRYEPCSDLYYLKKSW